MKEIRTSLNKEVARVKVNHVDRKFSMVLGRSATYFLYFFSWYFVLDISAQCKKDL